MNNFFIRLTKLKTPPLLKSVHTRRRYEVRGDAKHGFPYRFILFRYMSVPKSNTKPKRNVVVSKLWLHGLGLLSQKALVFPQSIR